MRGRVSKKTDSRPMFGPGNSAPTPPPPREGAQFESEPMGRPTPPAPGAPRPPCSGARPGRGCSFGIAVGSGTSMPSLGWSSFVLVFHAARAWVAPLHEWGYTSRWRMFSCLKACCGQLFISSSGCRPQNYAIQHEVSGFLPLDHAVRICQIKNG